MGNSLKGRLALITGASSGIGRACAELLAERGCHVILTGRRRERLLELCGDLSSRFNIEATPLTFDIASRAATEKALASENARIARLSVLINNAGLAKGTEPLQGGRLDDYDAMIDTNVKGLLYATRFCLPHFIKQGDGHIVNLGSVSGRWTYPGGTVYCATKFAVRAISESLRMDLLGTPIRVTNISPGMVETEFSEIRLGDRDKGKAVYKGMTPLSPHDVAESVVWSLERPAHVNIQEIIIYPTAQACVGPGYTARK